MLVQPNQRVEARAPRLWAALAAGGILSTGVALSGLGVATADEPKRVKVVVVADDEDQKKDEAKPKDGDKKDREKKVEMRRVEVRERADLKAIEKEIEKAAEKGDKEALKAAVEKLHKAIAAHIIPVVVEAGGKNVLGGQLHLHGPDGLKQPLTAKVTLLRAAADEETAKLEKAIEKLKKTAEELKDQPEARAAIEKSIAEFKKKIAEAKKKGEIKPATPVAPAPPVPPVPPAEFFRVQPGQFQFRGVPAGDMGKLTEQLAKQLEQTLKQQAEQLEALKDNPAAAEAMKKAQDAYKKAIEQAMKQLRENQPRLWMAEPQGRQPQFRDVPIARTAVLARGRLGVTLQPVPEAVVEQLDLPKDKGLLVAGVAEGSPAAKAGIKANDILLSVAGKDVAADPGAATRQVAALKPGEATDVVVLRKGKKQTISVTLPEEKKADVEKRAETPRKPDAPRAAARPKVAGGEGGSDAKSMRVTVTVNDDEFNIRADRDGVRYTIDGKLDGGKPVPSAIVIRADGKSSEFSSWEKVPAEHRDAVKKLLTSVSGGR